jgi:hypothetical protein
MKTLWLILAITFTSSLLLINETYAQGLGLNNPAPDASAILDMVATDRGVLVPRLSTVQRLAVNSPANGLLVFDTDIKTFLNCPFRLY